MLLLKITVYNIDTFKNNLYQSEFSLWWNHGYPLKIQGGEWYHYDFDGLKQRIIKFINLIMIQTSFTSIAM